MAADQQEELDLGCIELTEPARNAIALLCSLQEHGPRHLSGSEALIDYVTTAADEKDDFYTADLYQAAMSGDEGNETVALQAACQWLRNVKQHLSSEPPFRLEPTEIAALRLTRIDDLVETLTRAMTIETRLDSDWDFDINWTELEKALGNLGPAHVGGQPDGWIQRIKDVAACPGVHLRRGLYDAAVSEEGLETTALLAACGWLQSVKTCLSSGGLSWADVAKLHLVRIDELMPKLATALRARISQADDDRRYEADA